MRFRTRKARSAPSVIIVSLIDVLLVVLIFLMVSTTFKQHPAVRLALPESKQNLQPGASDDVLLVTVARQEPFLYFGTKPVTLDRLQAALIEGVKKNPKAALSIRADNEAPFGQIIKVMDAAKAAGVKTVSAVTRQPGGS